MNYYIVVEGAKTEKIVYDSWIQALRPELERVNYIEEMGPDTFFILSGGGYPSYFEVIKNAAEDTFTNPSIDQLVVCIDSEEMSYDEKRVEMESFLSDYSEKINFSIIIQHFCFEAWALGNKKIIRRWPSCNDLKNYLSLHDVRKSDPELLPAHTGLNLNRAQFSKRFLNRALKDRYRGLSYSASRPGPVAHPTYVKELRRRRKSSGHIQSFDDFLKVFQT